MRSRKKTCSCGKIVPEGSTCECKKIQKRDYQREYQRNDKNNPLKTARWTKLRAYVLKRDKYLCQRCLYKFGVTTATELQAHHIKSRRDYPELVFDLNNILTLCKICNLQLGTSNKLDFELRRTSSADQDDINFY
ncbi:MAG TPA: HNH endonuclease signature motif containing protein [Pseudoneobacillus sp.]|nr:HNH endonuclease signature motif containing protein [Pseudoneobacillus sp.]